MSDHLEEKYVTEEYREAIETYAELYPGYDVATITKVFCYDCQNFDELFLEGSLDRVRSVAWQQTKHRLERDDLPDEYDPPDS